MAFLSLLSRGLLIGGIVSLTACVINEPLTYRVQAKQQLDQLSAWEQSVDQQQPVSHLLDLIDSSEAEHLVQLGLAHNPELKQTVLAIQIAQLAVTGAEAETLPHVDLTLGREKRKAESSNYSVLLGVSWAVDIWGQLQDSIDIEKTSVSISTQAHRYARDLLAATIIDNWLQQIQLQQLIETESGRLKVLQNNESTIVERYRKGLDELTDIDTARSESSASRATLVAYQEQLNELTRAMKTLIGGQRSDAIAGNQYPQTLIPLAELPAQSLGRRPDLQQAYLAIQAAELSSSVAYKALLPSLSLSGSLSHSDGSLSDGLLSSSAWSLLGQLSAPLFQGGKLRAQAKSSKLAAEQSYWAYQQVLLKAVNETENALGNEQALAKRQQLILDALVNAQRSSVTYENKYRQGLVSFLDLIEVQKKTFDLQAQLSQIIYQRLTNRITLGLALGLGV